MQWLHTIENAKQMGLTCQNPFSTFYPLEFSSVQNFLEKNDYYKGEYPTLREEKLQYLEAIIKMKIEGNLEGDNFTKNCKLDKNDIDLILAKNDTNIPAEKALLKLNLIVFGLLMLTSLFKIVRRIQLMNVP